MENYLFVLLLSVFVLIVAFYVEQRRIQIKDELLQHENEIKKVKEELQSTRKTFSTQVNEEWEWMQKEVKQVKKERELTKKKIRELESTSFEQVSTAYGYYRLINQMRGEYVNKEVIDQIRADVNALREKLYIKKEKKDYLQPIVLCSAKYKEKKDYLQGLPAGIFRKDIGNVSVKLGETIIELIPKCF